MEETTTQILFTSDSSQNQKTISEAMVSIARKFEGHIHWLQIPANASITQALVDDLKKRANRNLTVTVKSGEFWSTASKCSNTLGFGMAVIFAESKMGSMIGGGMTHCIHKFNAPVLYLNPNAKWIEPKNILMLLDTNSFSRQQFFRVSHIANMFSSKVQILALSDKSDKETERYLIVYSDHGFDYMKRHGVMVDELKTQPGVDMVETVIAAASKLSSCWVSCMNQTDGTRFMKTSPYQHLCNQLPVPLFSCSVREVVGQGGGGY